MTLGDIAPLSQTDRFLSAVNPTPAQLLFARTWFCQPGRDWRSSTMGAAAQGSGHLGLLKHACCLQPPHTPPPCAATHPPQQYHPHIRRLRLTGARCHPLSPWAFPTQINIKSQQTNFSSQLPSREQMQQTHPMVAGAAGAGARAPISCLDQQTLPPAPPTTTTHSRQQPDRCPVQQSTLRSLAPPDHVQ